MDQLLWKIFEQEGSIASYLFYRAYQNALEMPDEQETDSIILKNASLLDSKCEVNM